ncbi:MAG: type II toxin-antitoxin system RelB/DinJ family antitoxin [Candidatus Marinimicrobia bacterium]|jgi:DNA-damage-inducible protein J|nr:type II toxin-antitoxin system RelB/DinJ family antitoxin [Candidatus Neomarinimicrobiota bacterium]
MGKSATIQARIDPVINAKAQEIFNALHISMSVAISLYLTQVALHKGLPFKVEIPNELTLQTLINSEDGKELHEVDSVKDLFKELEKCNMLSSLL